MPSSSVILVAVLSVVFFAFTIYPGDAIHCWVCSSDTDYRCGDPFNMTHFALTDCDRERSHSPYLRSIAVCRKAKQRVNNELVVVRSCNWDTGRESDDGPCSPSSTPSYVKMEYCSTCSTDACNSGRKIGISFTFAFIVPLAATFAKSIF